MPFLIHQGVLPVQGEWRSDVEFPVNRHLPCPQTPFFGCCATRQKNFRGRKMLGMGGGGCREEGGFNPRTCKSPMGRIYSVPGLLIYGQHSHSRTSSGISKSSMISLLPIPLCVHQTLHCFSHQRSHPRIKQCVPLT